MSISNFFTMYNFVIMYTLCAFLSTYFFSQDCALIVQRALESHTPSGEILKGWFKSMRLAVAKSVVLCTGITLIVEWVSL
jgi:hypothetical protein